MDNKIILNVNVLISIRYDININGAAFCTVINSAQFSHLNPSITPGNHQWRGAAPLLSSRGVQMIIGVYGLFSNVNNPLTPTSPITKHSNPISFRSNSNLSTPWPTRI